MTTDDTSGQSGRHDTLTFALVTLVTGCALFTSGLLVTGEYSTPVVAAGTGSLAATVGVGTALVARRSADGAETDAFEAEVTDGVSTALETGEATAVTTEWDDDHLQATALAVNRLLAANERSADDAFRGEFDRFASALSETTAVARREEDYTVRLTEDWQDDSLRTAATTVNGLFGDVEGQLADIKGFADEVATYSREVTLSTQEVSDGSERVKRALDDISDESSAQTEDLETVYEEVGDLSATVMEMAVSVAEVAEVAERTAETGREGRLAATGAVEGMSNIQDESEETVEAIERLEAEVNQIDELIEAITEIADQTNMLALNAHIEASRAGKHGQGFSVVAQEIKDLAERSKSAAEEVEQRLERIRVQTDRTVAEAEETSRRIAAETASVEDAADSLESIARYAEQTNVGVQAISNTTERQADSTGEVLRTVEHAADVSTETTTDAERIALSANAQATALSSVSDSTERLAGQANELSRALAAVTVDPETDS